MSDKELLTHTCAAMEAAAYGHWGAAIEEIFYLDGKGWQAMSGINEYFSTITYCPFCGVKL